MKKSIEIIIGLLFIISSLFPAAAYAQKLTDEEYNYITMDLRGILDLRVYNDTRIYFSFDNIEDYNKGIVIYNAIKLDVDATIGWDLFAYASTDTWKVIDLYSTSGNDRLPAEILEVKSSVSNLSAAINNFNTFVSLKGLTNSGVIGGKPTLDTQFLAGMKGMASTGTGDAQIPGTAAGNPDTHQFRLHYRLVPGLPATFPNSTIALGTQGNNENFAKAGYYYLEVIYSLVEDL